MFACCLLFDAGCSLAMFCCVLGFVCCLLFVVWRVVRVVFVCCLLIVAWCVSSTGLQFGVECMLFLTVGGWLLFVVCRVLIIVGYIVRLMVVVCRVVLFVAC